MLRVLVLALTVVTGFSGLAYEVTWQKYLAILLGAHGEATASVLGLFLGGLSLGYWVFGVATQRLVERGRASNRPAPLLFVYGCVEVSIGVYCLLFPAIFPGVLALSVWLPTGAGLVGFVTDVGLAAFLIVPPAMLMGGTIPILTQALARSLEDATRFHALVYAFNTAGAFLGALAAGFLLIPALGLDGVLRAMGVVNLTVGGVFVAVGLRRRELAELHTGKALRGASATSVVYGGAALLVGFAMMALQTILVRLGALSFGSSEYTFSMVVSVFVLCIALGSLVIGALSNIHRAVLPATLWALAILLLGLYFPLGVSPYYAHLLRVLFQSHDAGFGAFQIATLLGILAFIGPAVVLSGAVLPLLFHSMRREIGDLGAQAGRLYSVNTIGSLLGALVGGYLLLLWLDLTDVYRIAIGSVALAAALVTGQLYQRLRWSGAAGLFLVALVIIALLRPWDPAQLMPGLLRTRTPIARTYEGPFTEANDEYVFYRDDPTSSVGVLETPIGEGVSRALMVNGKPDGGTSGSDMRTMVLLGLIPALFAEKTERAFVIGLGLGISAGELARLDDIREVQVAEISSAVIDAAPFFDFASHGASNNPKIRLMRSDAYRSLLRSEGTFDIIVSEPSNPWVTGVEMLYTREFLEAARDRLSPGGAYAQWYHVYESDDRTLEMVLRTYAEVFDHVAVWRMSNDLVLLGLRESNREQDVERIVARVQREDFKRALVAVGLDSVVAILAHEVIPFGVVPLALEKGPLQTLYHPRLSHQSARAFFRGRAASLPFSGFGEAARVGVENSLLRRHLARYGEVIPEPTWQSMTRSACWDELPLCGVLVAEWARKHPDSKARISMLEQLSAWSSPGWLSAVPLLRSYLGEAPASERIWPRAAATASMQFFYLYSHALPFDAKALVSVWQRCGPPGEPGPGCRKGLENAKLLVAGGSPEPPQDWLVAPDQANAKSFGSAAVLSEEPEQKTHPADSSGSYYAESERLLELGQLEESLLVLDEALRAYPNTTGLLYARALLGERLGRLDILEEDLRKVIELEPENVVALNALGFTLTDRTDRHKEALNYIIRAFGLTPEDPAVIDSLGWVHYRLGNHEEAIRYLRIANEMESDHEIAAHLGEVLWVAGQKEEAVGIWTEAKGKAKDSSIIEAVMDKFIE